VNVFLPLAAIRWSCDVVATISGRYLFVDIIALQMDFNTHDQMVGVSLNHPQTGQALFLGIVAAEILKPVWPGKLGLPRQVQPALPLA
jgi:hypothetical protein